MFSNLPPNTYHVSVEAQGFPPFASDVDVRSAVPITFRRDGARRHDRIVQVVGHAEDLVERDPTAHTDVDQSLIAKLPLESTSLASTR